MEVGFGAVEAILKTLPIGYYCGRRVRATLDKDSDTTYYIPMDDSITVSYKNVITGLKNTSADELEKAVRCLLYHELSHAILTPLSLADTWENVGTFHSCIPFDVVNIFEDERIERMMDGYYTDVDFFYNIQRINDFQTDFDPTQSDALNAFYHAVRFRQDIGVPNFDTELVNRLNDTNYYNRNTEDCWYLLNNMRALWGMVLDYYPYDNSQPPQQPQQQNSNAQDNTPHKGQSIPNPNDNTQKAKQKSNNQQDKGSETSAEQSANGEGQNTAEGQMDKEQKSSMQDYAKKILSFEHNDSDCGTWLNDIERIFASFNKKNSGGSGISAYSGVFNPRSVVRKDYRFFDKSTSVNGNNKFGTFHLNMFIDCSGSFEDNAPLVNQLIQTLCRLERTNHNFKLDICFLGDGEHYVTDFKDKELRCNEGTRLDENAIGIFKKLQKPNTFNYNIVLLDGYAYNQLGHQPKAQRLFKQSFDHEHTACILDDSCKYLTEQFSKSKVTITSNYTEELTKNVIRALGIAFG